MQKNDEQQVTRPIITLKANPNQNIRLQSFADHDMDGFTPISSVSIQQKGSRDKIRQHPNPVVFQQYDDSSPKINLQESEILSNINSSRNFSGLIQLKKSDSLEILDCKNQIIHDTIFRPMPPQSTVINMDGSRPELKISNYNHAYGNQEFQNTENKQHSMMLNLNFTQRAFKLVKTFFYKLARRSNNQKLLSRREIFMVRQLLGDCDEINFGQNQVERYGRNIFKNFFLFINLRQALEAQSKIMICWDFLQIINLFLIFAYNPYKISFGLTDYINLGINIPCSYLQYVLVLIKLLGILSDANRAFIYQGQIIKQNTLILNNYVANKLSNELVKNFLRKDFISSYNFYLLYSSALNYLGIIFAYFNFLFIINSKDQSIRGNIG